MQADLLFTGNVFPENYASEIATNCRAARKARQLKHTKRSKKHISDN
jgi:hypothetical protein